MKLFFKVFLFSLLLFFITGPSQAQVGAGVRAGANVSNLSNTYYSIKFGYNIGTYVKIPLSEFFYLQPELMVSQKGGRTPLEDTRTYLNEFNNKRYRREKLTLDYIDLTALARFNVSDGLHFVIGPEVSFLIQDQYKYTNDDDEKDTYDYFDGRTVDIGINGGVGYEFDNGILLTLRGEYGFIPVIKDSNVHNYLFALSAGYTIFGKEE